MICPRYSLGVQGGRSSETEGRAQVMVFCVAIYTHRLGTECDFFLE